MMNMKKNRIIVVLIILSVILFIVSYSIITFGKEKDDSIKNNQVPVPKLGKEQKQYETKMEAIEGLREQRKVNAPSVYDERLLDSMGYFSPQLDSIRKRQIIDSVYFLGEKRYQNITALKQLEDYYSGKEYQEPIVQNVQTPKTLKNDIKPVDEKELEVGTKELALEHQLFFASNPKENLEKSLHGTDGQLFVRVDGTQTVKAHCRLRMRLMKDVIINKTNIPRNTLVYGFVSFQPNRAMIDIENINHQPVELKAFDFEDGSEGIYIENSFRAEASKEVIDDMVQDVSIPGVPQVGGIKKIFLRNNRNTKVTILNNYQLLLKENL